MEKGCRIQMFDSILESLQEKAIEDQGKSRQFELRMISNFVGDEVDIHFGRFPTFEEGHKVACQMIGEDYEKEKKKLENENDSPIAKVLFQISPNCTVFGTMYKNGKTRPFPEIQVNVIDEKLEI